METIRSMYESVLIYNFFQLVSAYISYDQEIDKKEKINYDRIYQQLAKNKKFHQMWPVSCIIKPVTIYNNTQAKRVYSYLRLGVNQFAFLNPCLCIVEIVIFLTTGYTFVKIKLIKDIFNII